jgi:ParB family chromosome partitioning protein
MNSQRALQLRRLGKCRGYPSLRFWIETNVLLLLKDAPFDKRNAHLVAIAGNCVDCPNRTGHNRLLFSDLGKQDACTNPSCYRAKVDAYVALSVTANPKLVQISTAYGQQPEGECCSASQQVHRHPRGDAAQ